jgi:hypothetical protein
MSSEVRCSICGAETDYYDGNDAREFDANNLHGKSLVQIEGAPSGCCFNPNIEDLR